jgi:hypothetical protein
MTAKSNTGIVVRVIKRKPRNGFGVEETDLSLCLLNIQPALKANDSSRYRGS